MPWTSWLCYSSFWVVVLSIKFAFGHFILIKPLKEPLLALWHYEEYCWVGPPTTETTYCGIPPSLRGAPTLTAERRALSTLLSLMLIGLRRRGALASQLSLG